MISFLYFDIKHRLKKVKFIFSIFTLALKNIDFFLPSQCVDEKVHFIESLLVQ